MSALNQGQQKGADAFFAFLLDDTKKELILTGPGGTGKTFLMGHLIDTIIPTYHQTCALLNTPVKYNSVHMTATTNKAAEVLSVATGRPTSTIHSHLGLKVTEDIESGMMRLTTTSNTRVLYNQILFIDEASMIDKKLRQYLKTLVSETCKIVYVCDDRQLAPVGEDLSVIFKEGHDVIELTEQMRTGDPDLMALHQQLRDTVRTGVFHPIKANGTSIVHVTDGDEAERLVAEKFTDPEHEGRIVAYANRTVLDYNDHVRQLRDLPPLFIEGEHLICNSSFTVRSLSEKRNIAVEEQVLLKELNEDVKVYRLGSGNSQIEIPYMDVKIRDAFGGEYAVKITTDRDHLTRVVKWFSSQKDWINYFHVKETFPDLRMRDAGTVHKAQGSTYEFIFIDLDNLSCCNDPNTAARLLYVAVSRAKKTVYLYGQLAAKYGGVIS